MNMNERVYCGTFYVPKFLFLLLLTPDRYLFEFIKIQRKIKRLTFRMAPLMHRATHKQQPGLKSERKKKMCELKNVLIY